MGNQLLFVLLFRRVRLIADSASACQCVMHGKLLLELSDVFLVLLEQQFRVEIDINRDVIADFHHTRSKLKSRDGFFKMCTLWPDIRNHAGFGVATNGVLKKISEFVLTIRNVLSLLVTQGHYNLLEERKRFVDELCLNERLSFRTSLLSALRSS